MEGQGKQKAGGSAGPASNDKHIPSFDFSGYPTAPQNESEFSPRIADEAWQRYEKQSAEEAGASQLRHDPSLLDKLISVLQMTPGEIKAKDKKGALQSGLKVLANILTLGKSDDPNQDITKSSSLPTLLI